MFKRKKAKDEEIAEAASVAELGLDFSASSSEEEEEEEDDDEGPGDPTAPTVPRDSVAETPALWSGHLAFCGALPLSTWPSGNPQRKGPLTVKGATRWFVITATAVKVYKNSSMAGKPQAFELRDGSIFLASDGAADCYLRLPSAAEGGMVLYFRPPKREKAVLSASDKKAMLEAQAAKMKAQAAANDPYPGLPSMDGFGRNKNHKDYGKGDTSIEEDVKKIKKAKKAAAEAGGAEPEPAPEPTAEEGEPPEAADIEWASLVEMTFVLAGMSVPVVEPEAESNPLLADFEPEEVKYTHHAPEPDSPDSSDSDSSEDDEPEDRGPQLRMQQGSDGAVVSKYGPVAAKCKGMATGILLVSINGKSVKCWPVDMVKSAFETEARPMHLVFHTQPDDDDSSDDSD